MPPDSDNPSRASLFGHSGPQLVAMAPGGGHLAWLADENGVCRAYAAPVADTLRPRLLTRGEGVDRALFWAGDRHLILFRDAQGDENYRALAVDIRDGTERALTPPGARALFVRGHAAQPHRVLFQMNDRDPACFDLVRIDVSTGAAVRLYRNVEAFSRFHANGALRPRLAERIEPDGGMTLLRRDRDGWSPVHRIAAADVLGSRVLAVSDRTVFLIDSTGRDTAALVALDLDGRTRTVLAADPDADIDDAVLSPQGRPVAASSTLDRRRWHAVDPGFAAVLERLAECAGGGQQDLLDVTATRVLARIDHDDRRPGHVVLDRGTGACHRLAWPRADGPDFRGRPLRCVTIKARDGLMLRSYLTQPSRMQGPHPLVIAVHGGPYDRDRWGFSPLHQWLASRGHAVLSVNFRGSTGFGKAFVRAGDREWGGRMLHDLMDGVDWAIGQGIADPQCVSILGTSYGGYAALMAAARYPDRFARVVSIAGPTDLADFIHAIPPYWRTWFAMIRERLADPDDPQGRAWLDRHSPLTHAATLRAPVLLIHGAHDVRVAPSQARRMADALAQAGNPATLAVFADEGHFITRPANTVAMAALIEAFLPTVTSAAAGGIARDLAASALTVEQGGGFLPPDVR